MSLGAPDKNNVIYTRKQKKLYQNKTSLLEFSGTFFLADIFEKVDFQLGNPNRWKIFRG